MLFRQSARMTVGTVWVVALCSCARNPTPGTPTLAGPLDPARQLVVIVAPDWTATSATRHRFARSGAGQGWSPAGSSTAVVLGRTGLAWGDSTLASAPGQPVKHEGDSEPRTNARKQNQSLPRMLPNQGHPDLNSSLTPNQPMERTPPCCALRRRS